MDDAATTGLQITLPEAGGRLTTHTLREPRHFPRRATSAFTRVAYSAAHVGG